MATLYVRNIPDELYEKLQELAKSENRSINAQVITLLQNILSVEINRQPQQKREDVVKMLDDIRHCREQLPSDIEWLDSTIMIREDRNR